MAESWNRLVFLERELDLDRNWTGESDRCDRTRLDPELELMFLSRTDVVGLSGGSGTLERNSLAGLRDLHCLADSGTFTAWRIRDLDRNGTGESDRCDRTRLDPELELMFLSRTDVVGLSCGSGTLERNSLAGLRDLHCLADSGTLTGTGQLGGLRDLDCLAEPGP